MSIFSHITVMLELVLCCIPVRYIARSWWFSAAGEGGISIPFCLISCEVIDTCDSATSIVAFSFAINHSERVVLYIQVWYIVVLAIFSLGYFSCPSWPESTRIQTACKKYARPCLKECCGAEHSHLLSLPSLVRASVSPDNAVSIPVKHQHITPTYKSLHLPAHTLTSRLTSRYYFFASSCIVYST
ncbi:hypothetical protein GGI35DRAFT_343350 [Trichoderma velutinum]